MTSKALFETPKQHLNWLLINPFDNDNRCLICPVWVDILSVPFDSVAFNWFAIWFSFFVPFVPVFPPRWGGPKSQWHKSSNLGMTKLAKLTGQMIKNESTLIWSIKMFPMICIFIIFKSWTTNTISDQVSKSPCWATLSGVEASLPAEA